MKTISCIAIDDEPLALTIIKNFCQRKGGLELHTYSEPRIGLEAIMREKPDIIFLDIEMNSITGLEIAQKLPQQSVFIFTTAHAQFALEGFNLDATDFLHKPFAYDRFEIAIDKAIRRLESMQRQKPETIVVKQEYNNIIIPVDDIMYIEAMENYTKIYRLNGKYILSRTNLKNIQSMLPEDLFVRVHKSFIVPVKYIFSYSYNQLTLQDKNTVIPIGRTYIEEFMKRMG